MSKVGQVGHTGSEVGQTHFLGVKSWQGCDLEKWGTISRGRGPKKKRMGHKDASGQGRSYGIRAFAPDQNVR
jgi:hypothetical protein